MTSEVEKLYENAGISEIGCFDSTGKKYKYSLHLPFTAEKQIELIKWLMKYDEIHSDYNDNEYGFATLNYSGKYKKDFEEALASVINNELWQVLTEEEKEQIRGILK